MGVIYKLRPEIKNYILEQKKTNPILSCRGLTNLIESNFQIKVSKSTINSIIKAAGLSLPVGRRQKKKRKRLQVPVLPILETKTETPIPSPEIKPEELVKPAAPEQAASPVESPKPAVEKQVPSSVEPKPEPPVEPQIEVPSETLCSGAILLRAVDYLIEGTSNITLAIKNSLNREEIDLFPKTESLIYLPLFEKNLSQLCTLTDKQLSMESILSYLNELQSVRGIHSDILRIMNNALQEVRCIKVTMVDGSVFYIDGQMHTIWSTPHIPYDFSATTYNIKSYINKYFYKEAPFAVFMAPGYDSPTKEFFNFILNLDIRERRLARLTLYDNRLEELEIIPLEQAKRLYFVFGLWPWQFVEYRKVVNIGEFRPFHFEALNKDLYIAGIQIELLQPIIKQSVTLSGCALKTALDEKTRLIVLTNLAAQASLEELAKTYLSHWPNLEEAFQDYSRKIELFTYTANSQRFFSTETVGLTGQPLQDLKELFKNYFKALDLYVRWHFLPTGYEDKDFSTLKEQFYDLKVLLKREKNQVSATFQPPPGYQFLKELEYACHRLNEREIAFRDGRRVWFFMP
jgi:hypothetical protein